jgi:enoyl-CoA hydratase/3-hydroxyacyl-CoA dehydrogenase
MQVVEDGSMSTERCPEISSTAIIGAGDMGAGIAAVSALNGYEVAVHDVDPDQLAEMEETVRWSYDKLVKKNEITDDRAQEAVDRIRTASTIREAVASADLVTEAVVERLAVKEDVFNALDEHAPRDAILATNTSGLSVTALAEVTDRPKQVVGTHWFNPPVIMELVELIATRYTDDAVLDRCHRFVESVEKTPIVCRKDVPKFIVNRCMRPYDQVAAWLVHIGEADVLEIDSAMKYREGFPMGPFELADYLGAIQHRVEGEEDLLNDSRQLSYDTQICPIVHDLYEKGHYGRKTGQGYYDYSDGPPEIPESAGAEFDPMLIWAPVTNEAAKLVQHGVASPNDVDTGMRLGGNWPIGPLEKADSVGPVRVVKQCAEVASLHDRIENLAETLPCDLLVEKALSGETFH